MAISFPKTITLLIEMEEEGNVTLSLEEFNLGEDGSVSVTGITSKAVRIGGTSTDESGEPASSVTPGHGSKLTVYRQGDARN